MRGSSIVLYDGECGFCNKSVQFIIKHDKHEHFHFAALQSSFAQEFLAKKNLSANLDSIVLIEGNEIFTESSAALRIAKKLDGFWKTLYALILLPAPARNFAYRLFAKNRYRLFGRQEMCELPSPQVRARFLDLD